jgi:hypothetical protein
MQEEKTMIDTHNKAKTRFAEGSAPVYGLMHEDH